MNYTLNNGILDLSYYFPSKKIIAGFTTNLINDVGFTNPDIKERKETLKQIFEKYNLDYKDAVFQNQIHSNKIKIVTYKDKCGGNIEKKDAIQNNDGLITIEKRLILTAWGADCTPVYFYDPWNSVIALVHSGREGTRKNIVGKTIKLMKRYFNTNPINLIAILGPGICEKCYQINFNIAKDFEKEFIIYKEKKIYLDIKEKIKKELRDMKVIKIFDIKICTKCDKIFHSYRRDGKNHGSGMAFIALT